MSQRSSVVALRLAAILVTVIIVPLLWRLMLWLPWQIDCLIAVAGALAFAYRFEREEAR
jgi:hypothetical protein